MHPSSISKTGSTPQKINSNQISYYGSMIRHKCKVFIENVFFNVSLSCVEISYLKKKHHKASSYIFLNLAHPLVASNIFPRTLPLLTGKCQQKTKTKQLLLPQTKKNKQKKRWGGDITEQMVLTVLFGSRHRVDVHRETVECLKAGQ